MDSRHNSLFGFTRASELETRCAPGCRLQSTGQGWSVCCSVDPAPKGLPSRTTGHFWSSNTIRPSSRGQPQRNVWYAENNLIGGPFPTEPNHEPNGVCHVGNL